MKELSKRYKISIIANQNFGSKEQLEKLGLLKYIGIVIALGRANCKPNEAVMVSDRIDDDIIPANKIGMTAV